MEALDVAGAAGDAAGDAPAASDAAASDAPAADAAPEGGIKGADALADACWRQLQASAGDAGAKRKFPAHSAVMSDIYAADYTSLLRCPFDDRARHPFGKAHPERKLCAHGAVARCRLDFFPTAYGGLFKGAPHCVIRLSTAVAPPTGAAALLLGKMRKAKLFPCVAVKAFRGGGAPSGNLLFAGAKTGHPETDFFAHGVSTQLTKKIPAGTKPILKAFEKYSSYPLQLGLSEFAAVDASGRCCEPNFPWAVHLRPTATLPPLPPKADAGAFVDALCALDAGAHVYDVYAAATPESVAGADATVERIGRVVLTSRCVSSPPDAPVVFKHQAKEEDYALRPDWVAGLALPVVAHDGAAGTVDANVGSKFFDGLIGAGRVVDREVDPVVGGLAGLRV